MTTSSLKIWIWFGLLRFCPSITIFDDKLSVTCILCLCILLDSKMLIRLLWSIVHQCENCWTLFLAHLRDQPGSGGGGAADVHHVGVLPRVWRGNTHYTQHNTIKVLARTCLIDGQTAAARPAAGAGRGAGAGHRGAARGRGRGRGTGAVHTRETGHKRYVDIDTKRCSSATCRRRSFWWSFSWSSGPSRWPHKILQKIWWQK